MVTDQEKQKEAYNLHLATNSYQNYPIENEIKITFHKFKFIFEIHKE